MEGMEAEGGNTEDERMKRMRLAPMWIMPYRSELDHWHGYHLFQTEIIPGIHAGEPANDNYLSPLDIMSRHVRLLAYPPGFSRLAVCQPFSAADWRPQQSAPIQHHFLTHTDRSLRTITD